MQSMIVDISNNQLKSIIVKQILKLKLQVRNKAINDVWEINEKYKYVVKKYKQSFNNLFPGNV